LERGSEPPPPATQLRPDCGLSVTEHSPRPNSGRQKGISLKMIQSSFFITPDGSTKTRKNTTVKYTQLQKKN